MFERSVVLDGDRRAQEKMALLDFGARRYANKLFGETMEPKHQAMSSVEQSHECEGSSDPDNPPLGGVASWLTRSALGGRVGLWELNLVTSELHSSSIFRQHFGCDQERHFGLPALEQSVDGREWCRFKAALQYSIDNHADFHFELAVSHGDDKAHWIELRAQVERADDGTALRAAGASWDVTSRHIAEDASRQAAILLRAVLETAPGLIYAKDIEGRMLIANSPALQLIGKPWEQVAGRTDTEFLDNPEQGAAIMANDRRIMDSGQPEELEERIGTEKACIGTWLSTKGPLRNEYGAVIGLVGVSQNITARKLAEEKLQELNHTLEARVAERTLERDRAWNNSQDLLVVLDDSGILKTTNPAWEAVLGWSREEVADHSFLDFIHPEDHPSSLHALRHASSDKLTHFENRYRHKDGTYRWIEWDAAPEGDRIYATGRHVTAEKEAAAALAAKTAQLEASNKELESFSYSISHDLRAPLRVIDGFGMMLEEDYHDRLDSEGFRLLSTIRQSSRRMSGLIDELLAFSRLAHAPLTARHVDVELLVRETIEDLILGYHGTRVEFDLGALPAAHADRGLLRQVWVNLLSNAIKYSGKHPNPHVEIRGRVEESTAIYSIRDNGVGFDMAYADQLFGVFRRLHPENEFTGIGVGLAIVNRIVTRHGGRVWAESHVNHGALFSFALPIPARY